MQEYDVIVIGAGLNGEIVAAYLAKAGAKVLLLEKKHECGGALYSEDFGSPFLHDVHATYMMMGELMPPYTDLRLDQEGLVFIRPQVQDAFVYKDGKALVFYTDLNKTLKSIEKVSADDVSRFEKLYKEFKELFDEIVLPSTYAPPTPILDLSVELQKTDVGRRLLEISELSPKEIIEQYGFKDERLKAALLYLATMWIIHPDQKGVGYLVPLYIYRMMNAALVKSGTHMLSSVLLRVAMKNGCKVLEWAEVKEIIVEDGVAKGVKLSDGREFRAKAIVSTLNPQQTFLQLIGENKIPKDLADSAKKWEFDDWSLFVVNMGIRGDPPKYKAAEFNPDVNEALLVIMGYESVNDIYKHVEEIEKKRLPEPAGHATVATKFDPSRASRGPFGPLHTLRWESWAPYEVEGKDWDTLKADYASKCIEVWSQYALNLKEAKVLFTFEWSPLDIERRITTMKRGGIKHGAYTPLQMGIFRPNEKCSRYRTPIKNLYVGGASVYPGGMVISGPGYNAAKVVAEDLGLTVWWKPPTHVLEAAKKGYVKL